MFALHGRTWENCSALQKTGLFTFIHSEKNSRPFLPPAGETLFDFAILVRDF